MLNLNLKTKMVLFGMAIMLVANTASASIYTMAVDSAMYHAMKYSENKRPYGGEAKNNVPESSGPCSQNLYRGQQPTFANTAYTDQTKLICFQSYALLTSGKTRTGIWSAELLTPARISAAEGMHRVNSFHVESQLPYQWQAQLSDYVRSGYDRGHMSPSGDQPTAESQNDSFSLGNMAPQAPRFNRVAWAHLEESVRALAKSDNLYVVTGLLFKGNQIGFLNSRVAIPSVYYKVVYDPSRGAASVFWGNNNDATQVYAEPLAQFQQENGIDFHMGSVRDLSLPSPRSHSNYDSE